MAADAGAARLGIAAAGTVDPEAAAIYDRWIAAGHHASMTYLERYADIRLSPQLLLPGTRTLLVCAFPYYTDEPLRLPIALYARGRDYHEVVRERLLQLSQAVTSRWGGETRACVDTAPLRERYWAVRSGLGFTGINNQLIVPGIGSYVFIGTLLWTVGVTPDNPCSDRCMQCMRCVSACPAGAINPDGSAIRAERCLSYLTIEHRGDLPPDTDLCGHLYGCDECQRVCPHNTTVTPTPSPTSTLAKTSATSTPTLSPHSLPRNSTQFSATAPCAAPNSQDSGATSTPYSAISPVTPIFLEVREKRSNFA